METSVKEMNVSTNGNRGKKVASAFIVVVLVVSILSSMMIFFGVRSRAASFSPRTSAPSNNTYYTTQNPFYNCGYGMPNCTCYAWGRAYEILGSKPKLSTGNASEWYSYNKNGGYYSYGSSPKLGAIACWSHHVAVVEKISGSSVTISESHYSGTYFDTKTLTAGKESNYCGTFYGYIYILNTSYSSSSSNSSSSSSAYKTGTYVVDAGRYVLNMRATASASSKVVGIVPSGAKLKITSVSRGWGKTTYSGITGWIALAYCDKVDTSGTPTGGSAAKYSTGKYKTNTGSSKLNLRKSASTKAKVLTTIPNGKTIKITSVSGSWGKTTYNGKTGWVALGYCKKA